MEVWRHVFLISVGGNKLSVEKCGYVLKWKGSETLYFFLTLNTYVIKLLYLQHALQNEISLHTAPTITTERALRQ